MRANDISVNDRSIGDDRQIGVLQWLAAWIAYHLAWGWTCYWWVWRAHLAARHGIPRSSLEEPPVEWMRVLLGPGEKDR